MAVNEGAIVLEPHPGIYLTLLGYSIGLLFTLSIIND